MSASSPLLQIRKELIKQIEKLGPMRKGTITKQMLPYKKKDGTTVRRGPYFTYTFKEGAKTKGRHLRDEEESRIYQEQIDNFRSFQDISHRLVEINQALADADAEECRGKKNSGTKSKSKSSER